MSDYSLSLMCPTCVQLSPCPSCISPHVPVLLPDCLVSLASSRVCVLWKSPCVQSVARVPITEFASALSVPLRYLNSWLDILVLLKRLPSQKAPCVSLHHRSPPDLLPDTYMQMVIWGYTNKILFDFIHWRIRAINLISSAQQSAR